MGNVTGNQTRSDATRPDTQVVLTIRDGWQILAKSELQVHLIGDNAYLGDYAKQVLLSVGYTAAQFSQVPVTRRCCPRPASARNRASGRRWSKTTAAEWLRDLFQKYGMGLYLYQDAAGVWTVDYLPSSWASYGGHAAQFTATATLNNSETYPGRLACLAPIDMRREFQRVLQLLLVHRRRRAERTAPARRWTDQGSVGAYNRVHILDWMVSKPPCGDRQSLAHAGHGERGGAQPGAVARAEPGLLRADDLLSQGK